MGFFLIETVVGKAGIDFIGLVVSASRLVASRQGLSTLHIIDKELYQIEFRPLKTLEL